MTRPRRSASAGRLAALAAVLLLLLTAAPTHAAPTERQTYIYYSVSHLGQDNEVRRGLDTTDIWRAKPDGSDRERLVAGLSPMGLDNMFDVDPVHGYLYYRNYWAHADAGIEPGIYRSDLRGRGREQLIPGEFSSFLVDEQEDWLYTSGDPGLLGRGLSRRNLDDLDDPEVILSHPHIVNFSQIVLDRVNNRIFGSNRGQLSWTQLTTNTKDIANVGDQWGGTLYPSHLDGSNITPAADRWAAFQYRAMTGLAYDDRDQTIFWMPWSRLGESTPIDSYQVGSGDEVARVLDSEDFGFGCLCRIGLFLNPADDKLYFGDALGNLKRVGLDGLEEETLFDVSQDYDGIARVTGIEIVTIPEPATGLLLLGGAALLGRRRRSARA